MTELGEEVFHLPVRIGIPAYAGGLADVVRSPRYATAVGLLIEGRKQYLRDRDSRAQSTGSGRSRHADEAMVQGEFLGTKRCRKRRASDCIGMRNDHSGN